MYQLRKGQKVYLFIRRILDIFFSLLIILLGSWFLLILLIINLFASHGHPLFKQQRVGQYSKPFNLIKFRTMKYGTDEHLTSEDILDQKQYLTKFGRFLRMFSLDELPQVFNIFIGNMSFIGPRPLIDEGVDHQTIELRKQNGADKLKPGITGLAQINGRVKSSSLKKSEYDGIYYQKVSFFFDVKIFFITIFKVLFRKDVFNEKADEKEIVD
ncbi:MAG: sugar transferase [Bacilli bacterium]|nr:sugar transferase [Bacilli bacterium]